MMNQCPGLLVGLDGVIRPRSSGGGGPGGGKSFRQKALNGLDLNSEMSDAVAEEPEEHVPSAPPLGPATKFEVAQTFMGVLSVSRTSRQVIRRPKQ